MYFPEQQKKWKSFCLVFSLWGGETSRNLSNISYIYIWYKCIYYVYICKKARRWETRNYDTTRHKNNKTRSTGAAAGWQLSAVHTTFPNKHKGKGNERCFGGEGGGGEGMKIYKYINKKINSPPQKPQEDYKKRRKKNSKPRHRHAASFPAFFFFFPFSCLFLFAHVRWKNERPRMARGDDEQEEQEETISKFAHLIPTAVVPGWTNTENWKSAYRQHHRIIGVLLL